MKKMIALCLAALVLVFVGCRSENATEESPPEMTIDSTVSQTDHQQEENETVFSDQLSEEPTVESVSQPDETATQATAPTTPKLPEISKPGGNKAPAGNDHSSKPTNPTEGTTPVQTEPIQTRPTEPGPTFATEPEELTPPITQPSETEPEETKPPVTEPPATEPKETEPAVTEITYEFKRQVASYAAQYINQYRGSACTVLPGMSQVAQYRASQLTRNYSHSTADKRAALAKYEYGRYIDATEFGDDASNSYWEADSAEAICAGFYGTDPKAMGKKIADLIRNSGSHWSYIGSSEYSYIGVGVEYREGTEYGWYACVMVGSVNYG